MDPNWCIKRYWTLTAGGGLAAYVATTTFNWVPTDTIKAKNSNTFSIAKFLSPIWFYPNYDPPAATSITATALASFGDFLVGTLKATTGTGIITTPGPGSFTVPVGVNSIDVYIWGAGGGGGGRLLRNFYAGGGGGGGGFSKARIAVVPGQVYNYNIGIGGVGSSKVAGNAGQN